MMVTTERRTLTDVDCSDNHPRDPAKEISEKKKGDSQNKGGGRLSEEILKKEHPEAKSLKELGELTSRQIQLEHDRLMPIWVVYQNEVDESEGFDVGDYRAKLPGFSGLIVPMNRCSKDELADRLNGHAKSAIKRYNKKMGGKFKVVGIEKANWCSPGSYFITFTASEENDEPKVFQAKVVMPIQGDPAVHLCRQKGDRLGGYRTDDYPMGGRRWS